jgi:hypothetical protein
MLASFNNVRNLSRLTGGGGFSPPAGNVLWIDASDISTLWQDTARTIPVTADGQPCFGITDLSGQGNHGYDLYEQGSYNEALTSTKNQCWLFPFSAGVSGALTVFYVGSQYDTSVNNGMFGGWENTTSNGDPFMLRAASSIALRVRADALDVISWVGPAINVPSLTTVRGNDSLDFDVWTNGTMITTTETLRDWTVRPSFCIGRVRNTFRNRNDVRECLVFNADLTDEQVNYVNSYLIDKWGL